MSQQSTIAIVFDFDDTLAPDSTSAFLNSINVNPREFWKVHGKLMESGWDSVPAYLQLFLEESRKRGPRQRIGKNVLKSFGNKLRFHSGVQGIFQRLRKLAKSIDSKIQLEFFIISSGIGEIIRASSIADEFTDIWASDFSYNQAQEIEAVKNVVSFTDKTRFLFQISKGLIGPQARKDPFAVNKKISAEQMYIPLNQFIFVGDGFTDVPCFSLIQKNGGVAIGVYNRESRERWGKAWGFIEDRRVQHLVAADYRRQSGLDDALKLAVDQIGNRIKLRGMTYQG